MVCVFTWSGSKNGTSAGVPKVNFHDYETSAQRSKRVSCRLKTFKSGIQKNKKKKRSSKNNWFLLRSNVKRRITNAEMMDSVFCRLQTEMASYLALIVWFDRFHKNYIGLLSVFFGFSIKFNFLQNFSFFSQSESKVAHLHLLHI